MSAGPPVVLVTGADRFRVVERFGAERDRLLESLDTGVGVDDFEGAEPEVVGRAVDAARTPSMFGTERLVVLRDGVAEETIPLLLAYLQDPVPATTLLLLHVRSGRPTKAWKELEKRVQAVGGLLLQEAAPPDRVQDLVAYVSTVAASRGVDLDKAAASHLASRLGSDAGAIASTVEQLAVARPGARRLGADDVAPFVSGPALARAWDLTDAIDAGDPSAALRHLHGLLVDMHPLQVHAAVAGHVRKLLAVSELEPVSASQVEADLGLKSFPAKKLYQKVRATSPTAMEAAHREVAAADVAIRGGGGLAPVVVLEVMVARLAAILGRSRARR